VGRNGILWMNRVLNIGNMSAQPFVDLKTGLQDWWENGSPIGVHASNDIGHATWTVVEDDPVGPWSNVFRTGSGYAISPLSKYFGTVLPRDNITLAYVAKNTNPDAVNAPFFTNGGGLMGMTWTGSAINPYYRGTYNHTSSGFPLNQWLSLVYTGNYSTGEMRLYRNGSLLRSSTGTSEHNNTWHSVGLGTGSGRFGCVVVSSVLWNLQQVQHFHNGGSFRSYAQL